LFFLGTSVCFYQKANARVNVLSLEEETDHFRATIKDLHSQEDNLIPQVNFLNALEAGKSLSMG
jgi:arginine/ornithine N-succinyltransferase beta subunit